MTESEDMLGENDADLADRVAEISERLRRGENVLPEEYGAHAARFAVCYRPFAE